MILKIFIFLIIICNVNSYAIERQNGEKYTNANIIVESELLISENNENVKIKIELDNYREDTDIYKNPVFLLKFPKYVDNIEVKNCKVFFDDELQIEKVEKFNEENIVLKLYLKGIQSKRSMLNITNGTNIIINADVYINPIEYNYEEKIDMYFYNENASKYKNEFIDNNNTKIGYNIGEIKIVAPKEIITGTKITGYNGEKSIMTVKQGEKTDKIAINESSKIIKSEQCIINNLESNCKDMIIVGNVPIKNIDGTTVDTILKTEILFQNMDKEKYKIYYSENVNAKDDIWDPENSWKENVDDLSKVKCFAILLKEEILKMQKILKFTYEYEIPEQIQYDNSIFNNFKVYYTNDKSEEIKLAVSDFVSLQTGKAPELKIQQECSIEDNVAIHEGQKVKYKIKITNIGENIAQDVYVRTENSNDNKAHIVYSGIDGYENGENIPISEKLIWKIDRINPNETIIKEYEIFVEKLPTIEEYYDTKERIHRRKW